MKYVSAGALHVAYLDVGPAEGRPVILLHGFPYDEHVYDETARQLEQYHHERRQPSDKIARQNKS